MQVKLYNSVSKFVKTSKNEFTVMHLLGKTLLVRVMQMLQGLAALQELENWM